MVMGWIAFVLTVISSAYQTYAAKKAKEKARAAADARKGFEMPVEGQAINLPVVYGRALIGGARVYHNTLSSYNYPGGNNSDKVFSTGNPTAFNYTNSYALNQSNGVYTPVEITGTITGTDLSSSRSGNKNAYLLFQQALCQGPINRAIDIIVDEARYIDDMALGTDIYLDSASNRGLEAALRIDVHYAGNVADNIMTANFGERSKSTFQDIAYISAVAKLDRDNPQFNGPPTIQVLIEGKKIRKVVGGVLNTTYEYSNNPAWVMLDYLLDTISGKGVPESQIELSTFEAAAAICDTVVQNSVTVAGKIWNPTDKAFTTSTRNLTLYECNIIIDTNKTVRENVEAILATMGDARLVWSSGKYKLSMQYPTSNAAINLAAALTDDDLLLDQDVELSWPDASTRYNYAIVRFNNESLNFKEDSATWPPKYSGTYLQGLGGIRYSNATSTGWDETWASANILNNYGVWSGNLPTTNLSYTFIVEKEFAGLCTLEFAGDDSMSFTLFNYTTGTDAAPGSVGTQITPTTGTFSSSGYKNKGTATVTLGNASQDMAYRLLITATDSSGQTSQDAGSQTKGRGVGLKITSGNYTIWTTRDEAYTDIISKTVTNDVYTAYKNEDNGMELEIDLFAEGITDYYHASAKAQEIVRSSRGSVALKLRYFLKDKYLEPGDFISITSNAIQIGVGLTPTYWRVNSVKLQNDFTCELELTQFDYKFLAWNSKPNEYVRVLPTYDTSIIPAPKILTYTPAPQIVSDSSGRLDWENANYQERAGYVLYMYPNDGPKDSNNNPIFQEIGRSTTNSFILPALTCISALFGVKTISKSGRLSGLTTHTTTHNFTASIAPGSTTSVMTVTALTAGSAIVRNMTFTGTGVTANSSVINQLTSTEPGGVLFGRGTYTVSNVQTVTSTAMVGTSTSYSTLLTNYYKRNIALSSSDVAYVKRKNSTTITPASITITATLTNFTTPVYAWYVNNVLQSGQTASTFTLAQFSTPTFKTVRCDVYETGVIQEVFTSSIDIIYLEEGNDAYTLSASSDPVPIAVDQDGVAKSGQLPRTVTMIVLQGYTVLAGTASTWSITPTGCTATIASTGIITITAISAATATIAVSATVTATGVVLTKTVNVNRLYDGTNAIAAYLTNEAVTVSAQFGGAGYDLTGTGGSFKIYDGATLVTSGATYSVIAPATVSGLTMAIDASGNYSLTGATPSWTSDTANFTLRAVYKASNIDKVYTIAKSLKGGPGLDTRGFSIGSTSQIFTFDGTGAVSPAGQVITFTAVKVNTTATVTWSVTPALSLYNASTGGAVTTTGDTVYLRVADFVTAIGSGNSVTVSATITDVQTFTDKITVVKVSSGASATAYSLVSSTGAIQQNTALVFNPTTVTFTSYSGTGSSAPALFAGRFKIYENGSGTASYISAANESSKIYTPSGTSVTSIKCEMYLTDGATKVDETIIPVVKDGTSGNSVYTATVYQQSASAPSAPVATASTYNFSTSTLTPPAGWSATMPASSTTPTYSVNYTFSGTAGSTVTGTGSWSTPVIVTQNGSNGSNGTRTATLELYKWSATAPTTWPTGTVSYTWATATMDLTNTTANGWTVTPGTPTLGQTLYLFTQRYSDTLTTTPTTITWSVTSAVPVGYAGTNGSNGLDGNQVAQVNLYQRATSTPAQPTGTITFTFATGVATGLTSGWTQTIPAGTNPVYIIQATAAASAASPSDNILNTEWSTATILASTGSNGVDAPYRDTIKLYLASASAPTVPTSATYTFSTNTVSGITGGTAGWTQAQPATTTTPTYMTSSLASTTTPATGLSLTTWSTPVIVAQSGTNGTNGTRTATLELYRWSSTAPSTWPSGTVSYTWATAAMDLTNTTLNGWSATPGSPTLGQTLYLLTQRYSDTNTSTPTTITWSVTSATPVGYAGTNGTNGVDGNQAAQVILYQRAASAPSLPSGTVTYTFSSGVATGLTNGWTQTIPAGTNPIYTTQATAAASATSPSDTIGTGEWSTVAILAQNGTNGIDGQYRDTINLYQAAASAPTAPTSVQYTFTGNIVGTITGGTGTWTATLPTTTTTPTYVTSALAATTTPGTAISLTSWSTPTIVAQSGTNGNPGANAVTCVLSNEACTVAATSAGVVSSYTGTGTDITVYEGTTAFTYVTTLTANSQFTVTAVGTNITVGAITASSTGITRAIVADHSAITATTASVTYTVTARKADGTSVVFTKVETITKAFAGTNGNNGADAIATEFTPSSRQIACDYLGTAKSTSLPVTFNFRMYQGAARVAADSSSITTTGCTATITQATTASLDGVVTVTAISGSTAEITLTMVKSSVSYINKVSLAKQLDPAPSTVTITPIVIADQNSTASYLTTGKAVTVTSSATGKLTLSWDLAFTVNNSGASNHSVTVEGKLQYRISGGTYADVAGSTASGTSDYSAVDISVNTGQAGVSSIAMTGLTANTNYDIQFLNRRSATTGTNTVTAFLGSITVERTP